MRYRWCTLITLLALCASFPPRAQASQFTVDLTLSSGTSGLVLTVHTRIGASCLVTLRAAKTAAPVALGAAVLAGKTGILVWTLPQQAQGGSVTVTCTTKGMTRASTLDLPSSGGPAYRLAVLTPLLAFGKAFVPTALGPDGTVLGWVQRDMSMSSDQFGFGTTVYRLSPGGKLTVVAQPPGMVDFEPTGMNSRGEIIGYSYTQSNGYVLTSSGWHPVGLGAEGDPTAINDRGQITGSADANDGTYAFLGDDTGSALRILGTLPCGCATFGHAISPSGLVVGDADDHDINPHAVIFPSTGAPVRSLSAATLSQPSRAVAINAEGVVGGTYSPGDGNTHLFHYDGTFHDVGFVPTVPNIQMIGMDNQGRIVGVAHMPGADRAFLAGPGGIEDLTTLAGLRTQGWPIIREVVAMNGTGQILAQVDPGNGTALQPVLLSPIRPNAGGMQDSKTVFAQVPWQPTPFQSPTPGPSPTPIPSPTAQYSPPAPLLRSWKLVGSTDALFQNAVLTLRAGYDLRVIGTITSGPYTFEVGGPYVRPSAGTSANIAGGAVDLQWTVPATIQGRTPGNYSATVGFPADFSSGQGDIFGPQGDDGPIGLQPLGA